MNPSPLDELQRAFPSMGWHRISSRSRVLEGEILPPGTMNGIRIWLTDCGDVATYTVGATFDEFLETEHGEAPRALVARALARLCQQIQERRLSLETAEGCCRKAVKTS